MAINLVLGAVNVNSQNTNAQVAFGQNAQSGWNSHYKNNYSTGSSYGIAWQMPFAPCIIDCDGVDSISSAPDVITTPQNQQV